MSETEVILRVGDCLEVMPTLPPNSVNMVFADLPYGVFKQSWDSRICLKSMWKFLDDICVANAAMLFTATHPFAIKLLNSNLSKFRHDLIWNKGVSAAFAVARYRPLPVHEHIYLFGSKCTYNAQMIPRQKVRHVKQGAAAKTDALTQMPREAIVGKTYTHRYPTSILNISVRDQSRGLHPTQKPIALLEWLIKTYTNEGDVILDPVAGSGTTAIAAMNVGNRKVICIEKDPTYFKVMSKRVAEHKEKLRQLSAPP